MFRSQEGDKHIKDALWIYEKTLIKIVHAIERLGSVQRKFAEPTVDKEAENRFVIAWI